MKSRIFHRKQRRLNITRLMSRDGTACSICGQDLDRSIADPRHPGYITFDHILPSSRGGLTKPENLRLAHARCNMERGDALPEKTA